MEFVQRLVCAAKNMTTTNTFEEDEEEEEDEAVEELGPTLTEVIVPKKALFVSKRTRAPSRRGAPKPANRHSVCDADFMSGIKRISRTPTASYVVDVKRKLLHVKIKKTRKTKQIDCEAFTEDRLQNYIREDCRAQLAGDTRPEEGLAAEWPGYYWNWALLYNNDLEVMRAKLKKLVDQPEQ